MVEFDEQLKNRLLAFQRANGLTGDGTAGTETWQALLAPGGGAQAKPAAKPAKPKLLKNGGEVNGVKLVPDVCNHPDHAADVLSADAVAQLAKDAGFTGSDLVTAVAIAMAESGLDRTCYSFSHDIGLWQINQFNWPAFGGKEELYKAKENAEAARQLFVWAGKTFDPWVVFKKGSYKTHLTAAQQAVNAIAAKPAPKPAPKP